MNPIQVKITLACAKGRKGWSFIRLRRRLHWNLITIIETILDMIVINKDTADKEQYTALLKSFHALYYTIPRIQERIRLIIENNPGLSNDDFYIQV